MGDGGGVERMLTGLLEVSHLALFEKLPDLVAEHARHAGLADVLIYLVDLQQHKLRLLTGRGRAAGTAGDVEAADELKVDGTVAGTVFQQGRVLSSKGPEGADYWWVPLLDGTGRLGVMRARAVGQGGQEAVEALRQLASLVALMLVSVRPYSDSYARLVRAQRMNVAAEMLWTLLPPLTFSYERVSIGAVLEPAYEIGGDAFDYAVSEDTVHVAIFDAMGHDVAAGLAANVAVAAFRNQRRHGVPLGEASEGIETTLLREFGPDCRFVTAVLAELDNLTGTLTWVNRGHPPPLLIRGGRWVAFLECPPAPPMGLGLGLPVTLCAEQLEPGDRVLLYTDGIIEARDRHGHEFGVQRFVDFVIRHTADGFPISETLRRLIRALMTHHARPLRDDATVLLLEWHGPPEPPGLPAAPGDG